MVARRRAFAHDARVHKLVFTGAVLVATGCGRTPIPSASAEAAATVVVSTPAGVAPSPAPVADAGMNVDTGTKGTIACGAARCRAGDEVCVGDANATVHCVTAAAARDKGWYHSYACDDGTDCEQGFACCAATEVASGRTYCVQPDVADGAPCILQACIPADGAPCPADQECREGFCRPAPHERATCDGPRGRERCPAEAPACLWKGGKAACAITNVPSPSYACTRKSDCGDGMSCCQDTDALWYGRGPAPQSVCMRSCETSFHRALCATDADCPSMLVTGANGGMRRMKCQPHDKSADEPPWLRHCAL